MITGEKRSDLVGGALIRSIDGWNAAKVLRINDAVIENMMSWHHSGFNVYCGPTIWPDNYQDL